MAPRTSRAPVMVSVIMGSSSDWDTMKHAVETLRRFDVPCERLVVSAHRTPELMFDFAKEARTRGVKVIIAGAGGAAHLPGMVAALTSLPVLGVPVQSKMLAGVDSLLSIVQMPGGVPTATFAIGPSGATNAALFAVRLLALEDEGLHKRLEAYRVDNAEKAKASTGALTLDDEKPKKARS
ncbi:MAG: 5-(carboxyamino)imidazole ribonucleotide mutase [Myxococcaceae bacterium]|nr:5-(carboxyamino)imidazole ribonucleotide mutase [Myxococcaceae bacterium]